MLTLWDGSRPNPQCQGIRFWLFGKSRASVIDELGCFQTIKAWHTHGQADISLILNLALLHFIEWDKLYLYHTSVILIGTSSPMSSWDSQHSSIIKSKNTHFQLFVYLNVINLNNLINFVSRFFISLTMLSTTAAGCAPVHVFLSLKVSVFVWGRKGRNYMPLSKAA